jgi:hypothetical protein
VACRSFLENHPALRADVEGAAFTRAPDDAALDMENFAAWWLEWPLSRWMDGQAGRRWFNRRDDRFVAEFTCPPELRATFESLTGELVDLRLAHYTHSRLASTGAGTPDKVRSGSDEAAPRLSFRAKVSHSGGKPILFIPPIETCPARPTGPTRVRLPNGSEWVFRFLKVACNVAHPAESADKRNRLPSLLREWFGPDAGLPGTHFEVTLTCDGAAWFVAPIHPAPT